MVVMVLSALLIGYFIVSVRSSGGLGSVQGFECGLDRFVHKGFYVSMRFFMISLLFLLMDLELVLMVFSPIIIFDELVSVMKFSLLMWVFVLGTVWEWWIGSIDWSL
uniref:NADH-ubiquinone oxidoreductase chain 3 n=1 Tax=Paratenuisentis ambiguus TaxID=185730 RepID=K0J9V4_PARAB|nr:NADH dehydrogenase subunit 3 [Paratenuisentis ambiguus]CCA94489.2 NADH dehydrogenase subunit 3 [Paratenuisentis ambiguus]